MGFPHPREYLFNYKVVNYIVQNNETSYKYLGYGSKPRHKVKDLLNILTLSSKHVLESESVFLKLILPSTNKFVDLLTTFSGVGPEIVVPMPVMDSVDLVISLLYFIKKPTLMEDMNIKYLNYSLYKK